MWIFVCIYGWRHSLGLFLRASCFLFSQYHHLTKTQRISCREENIGMFTWRSDCTWMKNIFLTYFLPILSANARWFWYLTKLTQHRLKTSSHYQCIVTLPYLSKQSVMEKGSHTSPRYPSPSLIFLIKITCFWMSWLNSRPTQQLTHSSSVGQGRKPEG